jgi:hypothetical protein
MSFDLPLQSAFAIMDGNHDSALVFPESYMLGMRAGLVWSRRDVYVTILKTPTHYKRACRGGGCGKMPANLPFRSSLPSRLHEARTLGSDLETTRS